MQTSSDLNERRYQAAVASAGWSPDAVKAMALRMIKDQKAGGSLLDFGAGTGDFLKSLHAQGIFKKLAGVDILARPAGLPESISWVVQDLNVEFSVPDAYDVVISTEVIEHLENPRAMVRNNYRLLKPGGLYIVTTPNQESIRSYAALLFGGHFAFFLGKSYPAHITALVRLDFLRILRECGFADISFYYTDQGGLPKSPALKWQSLSFGLLRGRLFSDNIGVVARKPLESAAGS
jgi:2-polyprenyl-3-methyl-5-hydroxy-6-metoxy-1,4-benzoquinol methylase